MTSLFDTSAPKLSRQFTENLQPCLIPLCRKRFNAHLIVTTERIVSFTSSTMNKCANFGKVGTQNYLHVLLGNVFSWIIKLPTQNVLKSVSDNVTCHQQMQTFLKTPCVRQKNMPLLQHPKLSPSKNFLTCKITQSAVRVLFMRVGVVGKGQYPSCPSVCSHASVCLPLGRYL